MATIDTLISVSALLPVEQRERFLTLAASFQSVPEDDEFLQILDAIGFMTLLWKEVPGEVQKILEGANPVTDTCHNVAGQVREAVIEVIPSYDDLKRITQRLEAHELALKNTLTVCAKFQRAARSGPTTLVMILFGIILGLAAETYLLPLLR